RLKERCRVNRHVERLKRHWPVVTISWLGLIALLIGAYAALPLAWKHYERHKGLAALPMVTRTKQGIPGDPINFGVVGSEADIDCAFTAAGWRAANPVTLRSSMRIVGSVMLRRSYPDAPVSALYYQGRREDLAFELAEGASADRRHHVRLWRVSGIAPDPSRPLWLGSDSFDRGVGVSHYTFRVTHHIDPDLDGERDFLAAALVKTGHVTRDLQVSGVGPMVAGRNGGGDLYFTDGEVEIERLTSNCAAPPGTAQPPHVESPWQVQIRDAVWRIVRPINRWLSGSENPG
ncbi:MAG TPA: LssY C-terminal domain-containing protein, partial [Caulobacteraceae bacterium]|nr:LssY C-terminal domain-containing protein [Caulobacteraceae bacterium]